MKLTVRSYESNFVNEKQSITVNGENLEVVDNASYNPWFGCFQQFEIDRIISNGRKRLYFLS